MKGLIFTALFRALSIVLSIFMLKVILDALPTSGDTNSQVIRVVEAVIVALATFIIMNWIASKFKYNKK
jgi:hypothetical protein